VQRALAAGEQEALRERRRVTGRGVRYQSRCLADVLAVPIKWLWFNRLARGKINLIAGNPGVSKSTLSIAIAAAVTTGGKLPDRTHAPLGSVIFITCEDDAADTIVPRLQAAGADMLGVYVLDWIVSKDGVQQHFDIGAHRDEEMIASVGDVVLIVIDPITAYCGSADSHKTADVRQALAPLQEMASSTGVCVVAISHLNKNGGEANAMSRVVGSGAFVAVARSAWLVAEDPADDDRRRRILTPLKNNIGDDKTGFAFSVEGVTLPSGIATSRVVFESDPVRVSADDLLQSQNQNPEDRGAEAEAVEFLADMLKDGPRPSKTVEKEGRAAGHSTRTLDRARRTLGVKAKKINGIWQMVLPESKDAKNAKNLGQGGWRP
jgi:hypothetical protein